MKDFNKYKYTYTKSTRFKLEKIQGDLSLPKIKEINEKELIIETEKFFKSLKELFFYEDEKKIKINSLLIIKKDFLKNYFKNDFYAQHKKKEYFVEKVSYLKDKLFELFINNNGNKSGELLIIEKLLNKIKELLSKNQNEKERNSEIAFLINEFCSKKYLFLIRDFLQNLNHKHKSEEINRLYKKIKELEKEWLALQENYLPFQTAGICLAGGSMNYYTVNKKSKEYFDGEIKKLEDRQDEKIACYDKDKKTLTIPIFKKDNKDKEICFKSKEESSFLDEYNLIKQSPENKISFTIEEIKFLMQDLKAKMKSQFFEDCQKQTDNLENKYYFFQDKGLGFIEKCILLTKQIDKNKNKGDKSNQEKTPKQKRGDYLIKRSWFDRKQNKKVFNDYFKNWVEFIDSYKTIAMQYGKIKASSKNLEKQQLEAEQNRYWIGIGKNKNKNEDFLWLIPKEKMQALRKELEKLTSSQTNEDYQLHFISSLTKRALHKLCFAEESTFIKGLKDMYEYVRDTLTKRALHKLLKIHSDSKEATNDKNELQNRKNNHKNKKPCDKSKAEYELEFMQGILETAYAQSILDLSDFDLSKVLNAKDNETFEKEMNSLYKMKAFGLNQKTRDDLMKKFDIVVFKITSYDLEKRNQNEYQTPKSQNRRHTKMWLDFWNTTNNDTIRLNPEMKINFRRKDHTEHNYLSTNNYSDNRKCRDQFTLTTTFTLNPNSLHTDLAFAKAEEIEEKIKDFNRDFNNQNWDTFYKYGIDRGNIELATLCIAKFNQDNKYLYDKNKKEKQEILKPTFPIEEQDIKCYELRKDFYNTKEKPSHKMVNFDNIKERRIFNNLSYFIDRIDRDDLFEQKNLAFIDLTKAKVIKDKIILNGDVFTYLKLKKEAAKKIIFENYNENSCISDWEDDKGVHLKIDGKPFYYWEKEYEGLELKDYTYTKEDIKQRFEEFLQELQATDRSEHKPSANKINHLRDALVANMIGVISFLQDKYSVQDKYPGFIVLEDLSRDMIDKHFQDLYINISRRLEYALFQKFQTKGFVPPHIKDLIEIRELKVRERELALEQLEQLKKDKGWGDKNKEYKSKKSDIIIKHIDQYGAIIFTSEKQTSDNCPYCENEWVYREEEKNHLKFTKHQYICGKHDKSCGFDTENILDIHKEQISDEINDPDKVAAYNVAKKAEKLKDKLELLNKPAERPNLPSNPTLNSVRLS